MKRKRITTIISGLFLGTFALGFWTVQSGVMAAADACGADLNGDQIVNRADAEILRNEFFSSNPSNKRADINQDGYVDSSDYIILVRYYQQRCETSAPQVNLPETDAAFYVNANHSNARDTNISNNSSQNPLKTISKAVELAYAQNQAGRSATVIIQPGTYRESVVFSFDPNVRPALVIKSATNEPVVISGSDVWTNWNRESNSSIYSKTWNNNWGLDSMPSDWPSDIGSNNQLAARREVVAVNGLVLLPVNRYQDLKAGTFYVNEGNNRLYVYPQSGISDLNRATVEVSVRDAGLRIQGKTALSLSGISVKHVAQSVFRESALYLLGISNGNFTNINASDNGGTGLGLWEIRDSKFVNITTNNNGGTGFGGSRMHKLSIDTATANGNNWRGNAAGFTGWSVAGLKHLYVNDVTYRNITAKNNYTYGYWCDTACIDITMTDSTISNNDRAGMFLEANQGPMKFSKVTIAKNGEVGVLMANSNKVTFDNSIFYDNGSRGAITFSGDGNGRPARDWVSGRSETVGQKDFTLTNSILVSKGNNLLISTNYHLDYWGPNIRDSLRSTNNIWYNPNRRDAFETYHRQRVDLGGWQEASRADQNSRFQDPRFANPDAGNFSR